MADKILIVDDDEDLRSELCEFLEGYQTIEASSAEEALRLLKRPNEIGLVILDVMMPGLSGLDILTEIKRMEPSLKTIILTGHSSKDIAIEALRAHADDYIEKPLGLGRVKDTVERLLEIRRGEPDLSTLDLKGKTEKVKRFVERNCCKKITLEEAANAVCLSPKYLSRVFKEQLKTGFSEYKLSLKFAKAKELLKESGCNINQIAQNLGYENAESFIRQFKKLSGKTPTQYRVRIKKKTGKLR